MNKKIMTISAILIVFLVILLIVMMLNYFYNSGAYLNRTHEISNNSKVSGEVKDSALIETSPIISGNQVEEFANELSGDISSTVVLNDKDNNIVTIEDKSKKEEPKDEQLSNQELTSNEIPALNEDNDNNSNEGIPSLVNTVIEINDNTTQEPIISSSTETSNQEKQQVLNEIDNALQGLLEAVGKVPTVDEQKLDASLESEASHE